MTTMTDGFIASDLPRFTPAEMETIARFLEAQRPVSDPWSRGELDCPTCGISDRPAELAAHLRDVDNPHCDRVRWGSWLPVDAEDAHRVRLPVVCSLVIAGAFSKGRAG